MEDISRGELQSQTFCKRREGPDRRANVDRASGQVAGAGGCRGSRQGKHGQAESRRSEAPPPAPRDKPHTLA